MTKQPEARLDQFLERYLGLEALEVTEELLNLCGACIDQRALSVLKRRLHEEKAQVIQLGARGYIRMREKSEQLITSLTPLIAALEEERPMTHQANHNIEGLRRSAQQKSNDTQQRAEEAIALLLKERRTINFNTVAQTAQISTAWLYANEDVKQRIIHLRSQQMPKAQIKIPVREQASASSKDSMITTLQKRVHEQAEEIKKLKRQLEVAYGELAKRARETGPVTN